MRGWEGCGKGSGEGISRRAWDVIVAGFVVLWCGGPTSGHTAFCLGASELLPDGQFAELS